MEGCPVRLSEIKGTVYNSKSRVLYKHNSSSFEKKGIC